jgi:hypothetical protein
MFKGLKACVGALVLALTGLTFGPADQAFAQGRVPVQVGGSSDFDACGSVAVPTGLNHAATISSRSVPGQIQAHNGWQSCVPANSSTSAMSAAPGSALFTAAAIVVSDRRSGGGRLIAARVARVGCSAGSCASSPGDPTALSVQPILAPNFSASGWSGVTRPLGAAASPPERGRNAPEPGAASQLPSRTIVSPRRRTVMGQPFTARPA